MSKSIADRKKSFLEDCCGGAPTMSMGDVGYQSAAPAEGPVAGYDPMLGKKKRKSPVEMSKRLRKEGYVKRTESDHDRMNDAAMRHDVKLRKERNPELSDDEAAISGKMSAEGDAITYEIAQARSNPTEYAKEKKSQMILNRERGFRKGKYKKFGEK